VAIFDFFVELVLVFHNFKNAAFAVVLCAHIAFYLSANRALVHNNISLFCINFNGNWHQQSFACVLPVAGVYVHMQRVQTIWTVIARSIAKSFHSPVAVYAHKTVVVFCKVHATPHLFFVATIAQKFARYKQQKPHLCPMFACNADCKIFFGLKQTLRAVQKTGLFLL
jgi:hypothetical protein